MIKRYCPTDSGMDTGMSMVLDSELDALEAENARLRQALKNIIEHQKKVGVTFGVYGATYHIAKSALEMEE